MCMQLLCSQRVEQFWLLLLTLTIQLIKENLNTKQLLTQLQSQQTPDTFLLHIAHLSFGLSTYHFPPKCNIFPMWLLYT